MAPEHMHWLLFAWVLGNQAGVPLPVVPALLGAGVLAAGGRLQMATIIPLVVAASLAADLTWYGLGRRRGVDPKEHPRPVRPNGKNPGS
jgi:membrane protein DedA with SNARE-associated domain